MVEKLREIFACTLRHLVVGSDLSLCPAARHLSTGERRGKTPLVCFCLWGAPVDASSHHMSDRSCQSTGQRDPGETDTGGERSNSGPRGWQMQMKKKAIKHCFKDGNGALGGKLLLTVICRIAPRILIDWLLWSLWSRSNAGLLFIVGHNQRKVAGFGSTIALPKT